MPAALKTIIPRLAAVLGESESTLYERQRALVRAGLLKSRPGHGRGSGVEGTPDAVAALLISLLASASLSEAAARSRRIAAARPTSGSCPLTGAKAFREALASVLADVDLAKRVNEVIIAASLSQALIRYDGLDPPKPPPAKLDFKSSVFVGSRPDSGAIRFTASLPSHTMLEVAEALAP